jgi:hypothetical protein
MRTELKRRKCGGSSGTVAWRGPGGAALSARDAISHRAEANLHPRGLVAAPFPVFDPHVLRRLADTLARPTRGAEYIGEQEFAT